MTPRYENLSSLLAAINSGEVDKDRIKLWIGRSTNIWKWNPDEDCDEPQGELLCSLGDPYEAIYAAMLLHGIEGEIA